MPGKHTKKEPINKGIGNYKGSGNFAMKNKVLAKSARYGGPIQKNFLGKVGKAMMGPAGMLLTKKPTKSIDTSSLGENVTNDPKYSKAKKAGKTVYKSKTGQITTTQGMPKNKVSKEQVKLQSEHASKVKKKTGRSFSNRYVSGDYSGKKGEAARKLDVEIANEYDGMPKNRKSVAGKQAKLEAKRQKRSDKADAAAISGNFKKARRNYKKADKVKAKIDKNNKTVDRAVNNVMSYDGMPKNRKLKKTDKKIKKKQTKEIKKRLSKLSTEELMEMKRNKENGLPKMKKTPTLPPKKMKVRESYYGQIGPSKPNKKMNRRYS